MKIIFLCTNYNSIKCGIGMYTYNLVEALKKEEEINVDIITETTSQIKGLKKIISCKFIKKIFDFINKNKNIKDEKINFILEYPLMDYNPFLILVLIVLKINFKNSKLILSLHEYHRVNFLRKIMIKILIKISDEFVITDESFFKIINNKRSLIRKIPSNILKINSNCIERKKENYCFFGLINKSKAFNEMIEGWKKFNLDKKNILNIYTASDLEISNMENYNIKIYKDLTNEELSIKLQENKYMILPIIPKIDINNGTLKAGALHGCIPIGIFSKSLKNLGIQISENSYSADNIYNALEETLQENDIQFEKNIFEYSKLFSFEENAKELYSFLK